MHACRSTLEDPTAKFYAAALAAPAAADWSRVQGAGCTEAAVFAAKLLHRIPTGDAVAEETALLGDIMRQVEETAACQLGGAQAERDAVIAQQALTQQHVRNIEEVFAATRTHATALEKARDELLGEIGNLRQQAASAHEAYQHELRRLQELIAQAEAQRSHLEAKLAETEARLSHAEVGRTHVEAKLLGAETRIASLTDDFRHAQAVVNSRDTKIAKLQSSFSWRVTAPLRAARRAFLDPPPPPAVSGALLGAIDNPADWTFVPLRLTVRGWSLHKNRLRLRAIRARLGKRPLQARLGLPRADVLSHYPGHPDAGHCGWSVQLDVPRTGGHPFVVELQDDAGVWHVAIAQEIAHTPVPPPAPPGSYAAWIEAHDTLTPDGADRIRRKIAGLNERPLISVLMPTFNTAEEWLVAAIESVRRQLYSNWELCIADDASTQPQVRKILERYRQKDPRIKVVFRDANGHISAASNSALELATGEFVALLDHDDELRPHALAEVAFALAENSTLEFIYSDEDKLDELGRRCAPYFKPDWNPDLLLGQNYTCHLSAFRTKSLREIGGFRSGVEGSQDWDVTLRFTATLSPDRIRHIPRVLYHWRAVAGSTALQIDQKSDYPFLAAKKALADHLARTGSTAELVPVAGRHWRIQRALPAAQPKVSIVIPTKNGAALLRMCIGSIQEKTTYADCELIVVNNRSDDPATLAYFDELRSAGVRVLDYDAPFNFSALNNFAAREARGSVLAFLNNDIEVITPGWLEEMVSHAIRPGIGAVGAMLYYPDDTVQHAGAILGITGPALRDGVAGHAFKRYRRGAEGHCNRLRLVQNYSAVTAACLVIRREIFEAVGGFNERDLAVAFNDIDFCLRVLRAGYRNLWTPFAEFYHHESASRGAEDTPEKVARFQKEIAYMRATWAPLLDRDPAYNPNLTIVSEDFSLAFPPR